jgi:hypothetical protein
MVIRHSYLWADERRKGRQEGRKERPALILAVAVVDTDGRTDVAVLAITHSPPVASSDAVPFPSGLKTAIGLDDSPAWIVTIEANVFVWPGHDLRPVPHSNPTTAVYGKLPIDFVRLVAQSATANRKLRRLEVVRRT